jgi:hypothetical protein
MPRFSLYAPSPALSPAGSAAAAPVLAAISEHADERLARLQGLMITESTVDALFSRAELLAIVEPFLGSRTVSRTAPKPAYVRALLELIGRGRVSLPARVSGASAASAAPPVPAYVQSALDGADGGIGGEQLLVSVDDEEELEDCDDNEPLRSSTTAGVGQAGVVYDATAQAPVGAGAEWDGAADGERGARRAGGMRRWSARERVATMGTNRHLRCPTPSLLPVSQMAVTMMPRTRRSWRIRMRRGHRALLPRGRRRASSL